MLFETFDEIWLSFGFESLLIWVRVENLHYSHLYSKLRFSTRSMNIETYRDITTQAVVYYERDTREFRIKKTKKKSYIRMRIFTRANELFAHTHIHYMYI